MSTFQRRHFDVLADIIRKHPHADHFAEFMARHLGKTNPNFDPKRFIEEATRP